MVQPRIMLRAFVISLALMTLLLVCNGQVQAAQANLSWGSNGSQVITLQQELNQRGYWCGTADGIFGSQTYAAVVKFQRDVGVPTTGLVGPLTRQALGLGSNTANSSETSRGSRYITLVATGYCPCAKCNYPFGGQPSYLGYALGHGIAAVDPNVVAMGSRLNIPGYGSAIAADQGNAIKGNRIDLCFATHQQALDWGIRTVTVSVL